MGIPKKKPTKKKVVPKKDAPVTGKTTAAKPVKTLKEKGKLVKAKGAKKNKKVGIKPFARKGAMEWKKRQTLLTCNGVIVAEVIIDHDAMLATTYYKVGLYGKTIAPGRFGYAAKQKAIDFIEKKFNLR